jgi:hypothetical protein
MAFLSSEEIGFALGGDLIYLNGELTTKGCKKYIPLNVGK